MARVQEHFERLKTLRARKQVWNQHWQIVAEMIMTRKADFTTTFQPGEFLNDHIFDGTAILSNRRMSSALIGALWGNGAKSFITNPPRHISKTAENLQYYQFVTDQMHFFMNNPKAGLSNALEEYMRDQGAFGTSGMAIFPADIKRNGTPITYRAWDVKQMSIDESESGFIDTVYFEFEWPLRKVVEKYGIDNISSELQRTWNEGLNRDRPVKLLHVIQPRFVEKGKRGNQALPWESVHYEVKTRKILRESGFAEMPIKVARFMKNVSEVYGRGAGMDALPDTLEAQAVAEALTVAIEKQLDPPLGLLDDGKLGGGVVDTSAGALNVFNPAGRLGSENPIFPLFTVGELQSADAHLQRLQDKIKDHFMIDTLLDFNIEKEMTLGEAQIRNKLRSESLGSLFARQITELFVPMVERSFNILLDAGLLGVVAGSAEEAQLIANGIEPTIIPDEIANAMATGQDVYDIQFLTPAMRIMQIEQAQGIAQAFDFISAQINTFPELRDNIKSDESFRKLLELFGFPLDMIEDVRTIETTRDARAEALEQQQELNQTQQTVETVDKAAQAASRK